MYAPLEKDRTVAGPAMIRAPHALVHRAGRWRGIALAVLALAAVAVRAQEATVRELREGAFKKFSEGRFDDAIPDFAQLIQILGDSKQSQVQMGMEIVFYDLALCHFLTGNFTEANKAFTAYIKKYPHGIHTHEAYVYIADALRFGSKYSDAIKAYFTALKRFSYAPDLRTDIYSSMARCYLALDDWPAARAPLRKAFACAPDSLRRNRAATLLATAYLKTLDMENIYRMVPFLLQRNSLASRSVAFNMAALEAGDSLFQDERYREAFWIHRLVYPHDEVQVRTESFLEYLQKMLAYEQRSVTDPRRLMRLQEWIGETEGELKALGEIENYDTDLFYRTARGYMEALRYREACELFLHLHEKGGQEMAEESMFYAFYCASRVLPWSRAYALGKQYMEDYPSGRWYDDLSLLMGQMYGKEQNWAEVIRHFTAVLQVRPNHTQAAECLFLMGYAHFMEEQFEQAVARLQELRQRFPQSELLDGATYWCAMASMFHGQYEPAARDFDVLLMEYPNCTYVTDAAFRRAVCNYALGQFRLADERLNAFLKAHPDGKLAAEAWMTRGDIAGAEARIDDAVQHYQRAMEMPPEHLNIEYYNHCAFQAGQILFDAKKFPAARGHYLRYIERNRPESNVPLAVYWVGRTLLELGEPEGAARYYKDAVLRYGADRKETGVDLILDEWVATTHRLRADQARSAWEGIARTVRESVRAGDQVAALRFTRLMMFQPEIVATERERLLSSLLQPENITNASPSVLESMLDGAAERGQTNLAVSVAQEIIRVFTETDYALNARLYLARVAIAAARDAPEALAKALRDEAIKHLDVVRNVFASSDEAAQALLLLGQLFLQNDKPGGAEPCFDAVLQVRGWSANWPEALYGRGLCAEARKEYLKATAYYERIYVMYTRYRPWVAKAYLRRAECLHRAYEDGKAIETLREMLANPDLTSFPESAAAQKLLTRLEKNG
jgi:TolA-binding protein